MFNKYLEQIKTYEAGKPIELVVREFGIKAEDVIKLASNENPLGASPKAVEAIVQNAKKASIYPDDSMYELKEKLAKRFDVKSKEIIIGAGSDQVLEFISHIKLNSNAKILRSAVTFAMYDIYAKAFGAKIIKTPSFEHKADEFIPLIKQENPDIIYICTPNNPTGDATKKEDVFKIIQSVPQTSLVVVDCAYMEYVQDKEYKISPKELLEFENAIYLGTFSKAYGLGGMRVGYGIANEKIMHYLYKVRPPFNITTLSLAAAIAALDDEAFLEETLALNKKEMKRYEAFANENNIAFQKSFTNFITYFFNSPLQSSQITNNLMKKGIIVRDLSSYNLNAIRITIGLPHQNEKVLDELKKELKG